MILLLVIVILIVFGIRKRNTDVDYMRYNQTMVIRGIFIAIIFLSHLRQYLVFSSTLDILICQILSMIGQLMVVVFFFYSGYGILLSYRNKENYDKSFFVNRLFKTWLHFVVAVLLYLLIDIIVGIPYSIKEILLSFVGWESIGNSNWFVFDILLLYSFVLVAFLLLGRHKKENKKLTDAVYIIEIVSVLTGVMIIILMFVKQFWWFDTLLCFPFGMVFCLLKDKIDSLMRNPLIWFFAGCSLVGVFIVCYMVNNLFFYYICGCALCLLICWFTFRFSINSPVLLWLGKYSFYIYLYMRIPMICLTCFGIDEYVYLFSLGCLIFTIILAYIMEKLQKRIDAFVIKG